MVGRPFRLSGSGREAIPDIRGVVGTPSQMSRMSSRMSGSGRETFRDLRELSGVHSGCPGVVGRRSRISGSGKEDLPDARE